MQIHTLAYLSTLIVFVASARSEDTIYHRRMLVRRTPQGANHHTVLKLVQHDMKTKAIKQGNDIRASNQRVQATETQIRGKIREALPHYWADNMPAFQQHNDNIQALSQVMGREQAKGTQLKQELEEKKSAFRELHAATSGAG